MSTASVSKEHSPDNAVPTVVCQECGQMQQFNVPAHSQTSYCCYCEAVLMRAVRGNNWPSAVLMLIALLLYIPANCLPIMTMTYMGRSTDNTIWSGVVSLFNGGMLGLAILVFMVSIVVPLVKIAVMLMVTLWPQHWPAPTTYWQHRCYRWVDKIGPWSMLDVFLVAILVALIKVQDLARVEAGPGLVAFAGVVVLTLVGSKVFDSRLLWRADSHLGTAMRRPTTTGVSS